MTCHFVVGSDEYALVIAAYNALFNGAVEEDHGDVFLFCEADDVLSRVIGAGVNNVDYEKSRTLGEGCGDLLGLGCLVSVCIVVLVVESRIAEELVHSGADAGDVGIAEGVVEHRYLAVFVIGSAAAGNKTENKQACHKCSQNFFHFINLLKFLRLCRRFDNIISFIIGKRNTDFYSKGIKIYDIMNF